MENSPSPPAVPDLQPVLTGPGVRLSPLRSEHWPALYAAGSDPAIWDGHPARDRWREEAFRAYFESGLASGGAFLIEELPGGAVIGSTRYYGYDPAAREIEIGWTFLIRRCWGGAVNREIKALLLAHALKFADKVVFWVAETNIRSQTALERLGAHRRPGVFVRPEGGDIPHVVYEMTAPPAPGST